ncbi:unnamed protein product [Polarella glacialis]|uniref:Thiamine-triphosphatase n=1 Tax=Polarella glacialis TaxID=89957 RepID=A0A813L3G7_POLGL|nr:unnamed protein product [Polarella glacialis]
MQNTRKAHNLHTCWQGLLGNIQSKKKEHSYSALLCPVLEVAGAASARNRFQHWGRLSPRKGLGSNQMSSLGDHTKEDDTPVIEVEKKLFLTAEQQRKLIASLPFHAQKSMDDVYYDSPLYHLTLRDWWLRRRNAAWELKVPWNSAGARNLLGDTQAYEEIVGERAVLERLRVEGLPRRPGDAEGSHTSDEFALEPELAAAGLVPFAWLHTERTSLRATEEYFRCRSEEAAIEGECFRPLQLQVDLDLVSFEGPCGPEGSSLAGTDSLESQAPNSAESEPPSHFCIAEFEIMAPRQPGAVDMAKQALDRFSDGMGLRDARPAHSKLIEYMLRFRPHHIEALSEAGIISKTKLAGLRSGLSS